MKSLLQVCVNWDVRDRRGFVGSNQQEAITALEGWIVSEITQAGGDNDPVICIPVLTAAAKRGGRIAWIDIHDKGGPLPYSIIMSEGDHRVLLLETADVGHIATIFSAYAFVYGEWSLVKEEELGFITVAAIYEEEGAGDSFDPYALAGVGYNDNGDAVSRPVIVFPPSRDPFDPEAGQVTAVDRSLGLAATGDTPRQAVINLAWRRVVHLTRECSRISWEHDRAVSLPEAEQGELIALERLKKEAQEGFTELYGAAGPPNWAEEETAVAELEKLPDTQPLSPPDDRDFYKMAAAYVDRQEEEESVDERPPEKWETAVNPDLLATNPLNAPPLNLERPGRTALYVYVGSIAYPFANGGKAKRVYKWVYVNGVLNDGRELPLGDDDRSRYFQGGENIVEAAQPGDVYEVWLTNGRHNIGPDSDLSYAGVWKNSSQVGRLTSNETERLLDDITGGLS